MKKIIILLALLLTLSTIGEAKEKDNKKQTEKIDYRTLYHKPETEAEKKLDEILNLAMKGKSWELYYYPIYPYRKGITSISKKEYNYYASFLTKELAQAIDDEEKRIFKESCPNGQTEGDNCGFEFDPLTCAQDHPSFYLYQTTSQTDSEAIIYYMWGEGYYRQKRKLIKQNNKWKLDGIDCSDPAENYVLKFNMN